MEFEGLNLNLSWYNSFEKREIKKAYLYALKNHDGQKRMTGEPYIIHPIEVAKNLILWGCDYETVCAGFLHDLVEDTDITLEDLEKEFNKDIAFIVDGVTKIKKIYKEYDNNKISDEEKQSIIASYLGHLGYGNCNKLIYKNIKINDI